MGYELDRADSPRNERSKRCLLGIFLSLHRMDVSFPPFAPFWPFIWCPPHHPTKQGTLSAVIHFQCDVSIGHFVLEKICSVGTNNFSSTSCLSPLMRCTTCFGSNSYEFSLEIGTILSASSTWITIDL